MKRRKREKMPKTREDTQNQLTYIKTQVFGSDWPYMIGGRMQKTQLLENQRYHPILMLPILFAVVQFLIEQ